MSFHPASRLTKLRAGRRSIDSLPPELLAEIFVWIRDDYSYGCCRKIYSWCFILLVCKKWYQVAVQTPSLWNILDLYFFERTCTLPLFLRWGTWGSEHNPLHRYSAYLSRSISLDLPRMPDDNGRQAFDGLTSLPLLEDLNLSFMSDFCPLAELFVSGTFPNLVDLRFAPRGFQWTYAIFAPTLRTLYVDAYWTSKYMTLADMIGALQQMPLLERLGLVHVVSDTEDAITQTSVAVLNNLASLHIVGTPMTCTAILNALSVPHTVHIDIRCELFNMDHVVQNGFVDFTGLSQAMRDKITPGDCEDTLEVSPLRYMQVQQYLSSPGSGSDKAIMAARLHCLRLDERSDYAQEKDDFPFFESINCKSNAAGFYGYDFEGVQVFVYWYPRWDRRAPMSWPESICRAWPLEGVTTVALDLDSHTAGMGIENLCPNVSTVLARDEGGASSGLSYLFHRESHGRGMPQHARFPKLKTLILDYTSPATPPVSTKELVILHYHLRRLCNAPTPTTWKIRIAAGAIYRDALDMLNGIKNSLPHIDIALLNEVLSEHEVELAC